MKEKKKYKMTKQEQREETNRYTINNMLSLCGDYDYKKVGISTSSPNERYVTTYVEKCKEIIAEKSLRISISEIEPIVLKASALEKAKECDVIFLIERYAYCDYKAIESIQDIVKNAKVNLGGIIAYK